MSINMRQLSPDVYKALENLCFRKGWPSIFGFMESEVVAPLFFRLKYIPDDEVSFPRGKWATIQRLQDLLDKEAQEKEKE